MPHTKKRNKENYNEIENKFRETEKTAPAPGSLQERFRVLGARQCRSSWETSHHNHRRRRATHGVTSDWPNVKRSTLFRFVRSMQRREIDR